MITVNILRFLCSVSGLSHNAARWLLLLFATALTIIVGATLFRRYQEKKQLWGMLIVAVLLVFLWIKWIPYFQIDQVIVPELVDQTSIDDSFCPLVSEEFEIPSFPFRVKPPLTYLAWYRHKAALAWIEEKITETDEYTYLIAHDCEIQSVSYSAWDGEDHYPAPWYGLIMYPEYQTAPVSEVNLRIYRIPRVAIWSE